jgi:uncharacterized protein (TIGR03067 family)
MSISKHVLLTVILTVFFMVALSHADDFNGTWKGHQVQGEPGNWTFVFKDSSLVVYGPNPGEYFKLETKILPEKKHKRMKAVFKDGSDPTVINMETIAIYKFEEGKLIIAANEPGYGGAPSSFEATWGVFVFELKKEAKSK